MRMKQMIALLFIFIVAFPIQSDKGKAQEVEQLIEEMLPAGAVQQLEVHEMTWEEAKKLPIYSANSLKSKAISIHPYQGSYGYEQIKTEYAKVVYRQLKEASEAFHYSSQDATETTYSDGKQGYIAVTIALEKNKLHQDNVAEAVINFIYDNPQYFWSGGYSYYMNRDKYVTQISLSCGSEQRNGEERLKIWNKMEKKIQTYLDLIAGLSHDYERELTLHDALAKQITYAYTENRKPVEERWAHTIVGVFDEQYNAVVCEGYSKAFQLLLNAAGIKNNYVVGDGKSGAAVEGHAWNQVQIEEEWYHVDLTWNDSNNAGSHRYFNATDETFLSNHTPYGQKIPQVGNWCYVTQPCTATEYTYEKKGSIVKGQTYPVLYNQPEGAAYCVYNQGIEVVSGTSVKAGTVLVGRLTFPTEQYYDVAIMQNEKETNYSCISGKETIEHTIAVENAGVSIQVTATSIPVTDIVLNQKTAEILGIGNNLTLEATVFPQDATNQRIIWETSDDTVATVENGKVTAKKAGEAVITAKTEDGAWKSSCTVNVTALHQLTFYNKEGAVAALIENIPSNTTITLPSTPFYAGYIFAGWYTKIAGEDIEVTKATKITQDMLVYGQWKEYTDFLKQVSVNYSAAIYVGKTSKATVKLPKELARVSSFAADELEPITASQGAVKITFSSNNKKVATVNAATGKISAKKAGVATITTKVELSTGSSQEYQTTVTVKNPSLVIWAKSYQVKKGKSLKLQAKKYGIRGSVKWSVSNKKAKINRKTGKLTAKKTGTVYVTAKLGNIKSKCKIKIIK